MLDFSRMTGARPRAFIAAFHASPAGPAPMTIASYASAKIASRSALSGIATLRLLPRADHILHKLLGVRLRRRLLGELAAPVHDDDAVGAGESVRQDVGDKNHRNAAIFQRADEFEHLLLLRDRKSTRLNSSH